jgi:hypothetical protein
LDLQTVLQGIGIGQLASFFGFPHLEDGSLQPLLMNYVAAPKGLDPRRELPTLEAVIAI